MASITIRNIDAPLMDQLRINAAQNGNCIEEEARMILGRALIRRDSAGGLGSRIRQRFSSVGGIDLALPSRQEKARVMDFPDC
ncbi:FitA-like ribbon-helix-helix domain-containing protein [Pseudomonas fluorescens]|uniref:FitA-like ribbon-helix-helix domain-containing protein n=1 Tax=Pseudomonas fluorescens TaxID=294 RepID=UPI001CA6E267|nr:plasmid stabilization protein [Pseudomonas fluorescens]MBY8933913.1 plasmid stabilization protein [Pseudomonas fluorescens]